MLSAFDPAAAGGQRYAHNYCGNENGNGHGKNWRSCCRHSGFST